MISYREYLKESAKLFPSAAKGVSIFSITFKTKSNDPAVIALTLDNKPFRTSNKFIIIKVKKGRFWKNAAMAAKFKSQNNKSEQIHNLFSHFANPWADKDIQSVPEKELNHWLKFMANDVDYKRYTNVDEFLRDLVGKFRIHHEYIRELGILNGMDLISKDENIFGFDMIYETSITDRKKEEIKKLLSDTDRVLSKFKLNKKLMYGNCIVAKTLRGNTLGLYYSNDDTIKLKSNVKANSDALHTIVHELGHRHYYMILNQNQRDEIAKFYFELIKQGKGKKEDSNTMNVVSQTLLDNIKIGDTIDYIGRGKRFKEFSPYEVTSINSPKIEIASKELNRIKLEAHILGFADGKWKHNGKVLKDDSKKRELHFNDDYFTSNYSKTNEKEFYAELFAYYITGKIKNKNVLDYCKKYIK